MVPQDPPQGLGRKGLVRQSAEAEFFPGGFTMSDVAQLLESHVSAADWAAQADQIRMTVDALKNKVVASYETMSGNLLEQEPRIVLGETKPADGSWSQDFDVSFLDVLAVRGKLSVTGTTPSDWSGELTYAASCCGVEFVRKTYQLDAGHLGGAEELNFLNIAKLKIGYVVGFSSREVTLGFKGSASYYDLFKGWRSADFDITVLRIPVVLAG